MDEQILSQFFLLAYFQKSGRLTWDKVSDWCWVTQSGAFTFRLYDDPEDRALLFFDDIGFGGACEHELERHPRAHKIFLEMIEDVREDKKYTEEAVKDWLNDIVASAFVVSPVSWGPCDDDDYN